MKHFGLLKVVIQLPFQLNGKRYFSSNEYKSNIMIFASEAPVIASINRFRQIEDIFENVWMRTNREQYERVIQQHRSVVETKEERIERIIETSNAKPIVEKIKQMALETKEIQHVDKASKVVEQQIKQLDVAPETKGELEDHLISIIRTDFGEKYEVTGIEHFEKTTGRSISERNLTFHKRRIDSINGYELFVGGRIDGRSDGKVVEVKNRMKKFMTPIPMYDIAQLQTYLFILNVSEGEIIESLKSSQVQTKSTLIQRDDEFWNKKILPNLMYFAKALTLFMQNKDAQLHFLATNSTEKKNIIKDFWLQP